MAVAGGETNLDPGAGTGLVQDVDNTNYTDTWNLALTSYRLLTNQIINPANAITGDGPYTCTNGYHFRMASTGTWNTATNTWSSDPQTEIDQAETPETALGSTNNLISTQQAPNGGTFIPPADYTQQLSFTDATVSASTPLAANAGQGSVNLDYYHSAAFNSMDLYGQVYLHCNPNTSS